MDVFLQDLGSALRAIVRRPGFTGVSVFTLALGIGANTAIFSVVSAVLLGGLPFAGADRLVQVVGTGSGGEAQLGEVSYPDYRDLAAAGEVFGQIAATETGAVSLSGGVGAEHLQAAFVSPVYLAMLGARPAHGRLLSPDDDCRCPPVVVVSHRVWERQLGGDPDAVGEVIRVNGVAATVVGVMDAGFRGVGDRVDAWLPLLHGVAVRDDRPAALFESRDRRLFSVMARLGAGVSLDDARVRAEAVAARLRRDYPVSNAGRGFRLVPLEEWLLGEAHGVAVFLLVAVGLVLLIACANVANLRIARDTARREEIALRHALGASRGRLVRYLVTESMAVAVVGGAVGLIAALWLTDLLGLMNPVDLPEFIDIGLDGSAVLFAFALSVATGVAFGAWPALKVSEARAAETLRNAGRSVGASPRSERLDARSAVVIGQVSLALVVLIGAGLMIRTFAHQLRIDPGVDPDNLLTLSVQLPSRRYDAGDVRRFVQRMSDGLGALPAVEAVATTTALPFGGRDEAATVLVEDALAPAGLEELRAYRHRVGPGYFAAMGIPVVWGRAFTSEDDDAAPPVAIVSETMVRRTWPGEELGGKRIAVGDAEPRWYSVVGVVADVKHRGLTPGGDDQPDVYLALYQEPASRIDVALRATAEPMLLADAVRRGIRWLDRDVAVYNMAPFDDLIDAEVATSRLASLQLGSYGLLALVLAAIGLYGVVSHAVARRMNEISVRIALGAGPGAVIAFVLRQGVRMIAAGVVLGLLGAFVVTKMISHQLYGVSATDPATYAAVTIVLAAVGLLACLVPARRALKADPIEALKQE